VPVKNFEKIGQYLAKIWTKVCGVLFGGHHVRVSLYKVTIASFRTNPVGHDVSIWTAMMAVENENCADDGQWTHEHDRREVHTCTVYTPH